VDLTRQINSVPKNGGVAHSTQNSNRPNQSRHGEEGFEFHKQMLEQAVASLKAAGSPSVDKGSRSTVGTLVPRTYAADLPPRATDNAGSLEAEWETPAKGRRAIRAFAALALFFTGYGAALFTDLAAPELITNLGVWAMEYSGPLGGEGRQTDALVSRKSSSALDERATLRRDLKAALDEISIAKDKEAEWMRIFAEDDTKAVALSRDLEAARREITSYIAAVGTMRSEVSEARNATATAEAKVQGLMLAIGLERDKVNSLTRDLLSVREELIARSASDTAARNEFLQERRTAEVTENEWKRRLDSVTQELDQLRNRAATPTNSRQLPASVLPASELQVTPQPDPAATWALSSSGNRDRAATPRLARPLTGLAIAAEGPATDEATLLARAEYFLGQADIAGARRFLERAFEKGSARAAFVLAQTYDAEFLQSLQTVGVRADTDKAMQFYEAAAAAGIEQAKERLQALNSIERR